MRVCSACSRENPDDRDFCECGEYLRWDPTGVVQAITPEVLQAAQDQAPPAAQTPAEAPPAQPQQPAAQPPQPAPAQQPPAHPQASPALPQTPASPPNGGGSPVVSGDPLAGAAPPPPPPAAPAPPAPTAQPPAAQQPPKTPTLQQPAAPAPAPPPEPAEPDPAAITLRLPEGDHGDLGQTLAVGVEPGGRARVVALVRNQSGIVDNYELSVLGLPGDWWSIFPNTVYLVPFGTSGTYEQEVEIHLHPPRAAEAEARIWDLQVVGESKAYQRQAAAAPLKLGIQPFEEFKTKLSPERASGRKKAQYDIAVRNTANAPVTVALDAADQDNELEYAFKPTTLEIPPGQSHEAKMLVKPPRQRWIGRPEEKRIQVFTKTGEEANQAKTADDMELPEGFEAEEGEGAGAGAKGAGKGFLKRFRVTGPRATAGSSGLQLQGPRVSKPAVPSKNVDLMKLKAPGGMAVPQMPLMPNQVVFRHKAWLPWWVALLLPLLLLLALLLFLFLPRNVTVPEVTGAKSAFEAEQKLVKSDLKLAPAPKEKVSTEAPPGTVIGQTPAAGEKAKKDSEVALEIAVGNGKVQVPNVVGQTQVEAEKTLRGKNLTIGQIQPQPPDPKAKISSQIPAAEEVVTEGKPIDLFMATLKDKKKKGGDDDKDGGGGGGGGGGKAAAVTLPALAGLPVAEAAQKAADEGLVPEKVTEFSKKKKGELIRTEPGPGTELKAGDKVKLVVSGGFPRLTFDNGEDVLLANGADGKRFPAVAKGSQRQTDPTFSADGTKVAFLSDRRLMLKDLSKPDEPPVGLTQPGEKFSDPAWAPTVDANVIAVLKDKSPGGPDAKRTDQDLCLLQVTKEQQSPKCMTEPDFTLEKTVRWAPDGKTLFAFGVKGAGGGTFGMVRYKSKKPFSPERSDWGKGKFVTDITEVNKGVLDFSISPDGKRMIAVANFDDDVFQLYLGKPKDVGLSDAKPLGVQACKATWRSDGKEIVIVQADEVCSQDNGQIVRMPINDPAGQQLLGFRGDNPALQPLTLE